MSPTVVQQPREGQRNSLSVSQTKGLLNGPGQNNCFLNSAVQVLWHLDIFRRSFRELGGHACMEDSCIFCALKELFAQFQYSRESALPPDALRRALAETFFNQQRFQLGFMDDAAECFENILQRIHFHIANAESEDMCNATHCIPHQKFAMTLVEQSICHACGATSEPLPFTQMVHYVSASAMCLQAKQIWKEGSQIGADFGQLLRRAGGMGDIRECPSSCGAKIQICRSLMNRPEIVSVGIVWDSEHPTLEHIMNVFTVIGTSVRLPDVFHSVVDRQWASTSIHHLVGVVTYYGKHYSTFFFHTKLHVWIYFDDATVREIGPRWEQVVEKCQRGHFQPLLLLYANPQGDPISLETAPQNITYVTGHGKPKDEPTAKPEVSKVPSTSDHSRFYLNSQVPIQRRAVTPNPESAREMMKDSCQRRALTPNPDTFLSGDVPTFSSKGISQSQILMNKSNEDKMYVHSFAPASSQCAVGMKTSHNVNGEARMSIDDLNTAKHGVETPVNSYPPDVGKQSSMYISRKAVENVLNYQKLQRQRSLSTGNYTSIGNRNSNSSLESFDNTIRPRNAFSGTPPDTKSDLIDFAGSGRRRDSGNWSGDRNSASSGSSLSLENPQFYIAMKQPGSPGYRQQPGKPVEIMANPMYDPGYDSYSLSSNDSYPLSPQTKHNQQLAQIPEVPARDYYENNYIQLHNTEAVDECVKLCVEAEQFLEKSKGLEDSGDFAAALSLCNSAAAKARAAMDAPYSNPQSLVVARMKHNACVMRARSLHRRFLMRQESINSHGSTTSTETDSGESSALEKFHQGNHSRQASSDSQKRKDNHSRQNSKDGSISHSRQNSRESRQSNKEFSCHTRQGSKDSSKKGSVNIEIYATLPKKLGKKKLEKISTGSFRAKDGKFLQPSIVQKAPMSEPTTEDCSNIDKNVREICKDKKKDGVKSDKESEFSDYASKWDMTKKTKLHRTYSSPPIRTTPLPGCQQTLDPNKDKPNAPKANAQPGKKQHKIRRKLLMGGLIRRKNRSMPDLREGQDGSEPLQNQHAFDDLQLSQGDRAKRNFTGYLSDAHLDYAESDGRDKSQYNKLHYGSCRQLSQLQNKMPPQPPVRTTSQLTLNAVQQLPHTKPTSLSNEEYPCNPANSQMINVQLKNCAQTQNAKPLQISHQIVNQSRKPPVLYVPAPLIQPSAILAQQPPLPAKGENKREGPPEGPMKEHTTQYCNYSSVQRPTSPLAHILTNCKGYESPSHAHMKFVPSSSTLSATDAIIQEHVHTSKNNPESNSLLQELQVKRQHILNRKPQDEVTPKHKLSIKAEEVLTSPVKRSSWLEELQVKQCQMLQKRGIEHQSSELQSSINNDENKMLPQHVPHPQNYPQRKQSLNLNHLEINCVQQFSPENDVAPCSVRDLASRFEQIVSPTSTKPPVEIPVSSGSPAVFPETAKSPTGASPQTFPFYDVKLLPPPALYNNQVSGHLKLKNDSEQVFCTVPKPAVRIPLHQQDLPTAVNSNMAAPPIMKMNTSASLHENQAQLGYGPKPTNSPYQMLPPQSGNFPHSSGHLKSGYESRNPPQIPSRGLLANNQQPPSIQKDCNRTMNCNVRPLGKEGQQPPPYHAAINALHRPPGALNHNSFHHAPQLPNHMMPNMVNEKIIRDINGYVDIASTNYINQYYPGKPYVAVQPRSGQVEHHHYMMKPPSSGDIEKPRDFQTVQNIGKEFIVNISQTECDGAIKQTCNSKSSKIPMQANGEIKTESHGISPTQLIHQNNESHMGNNMKKRTKPKKSVTFSDQIALVASADDEPEEFLPNPLLQRVYKSLVQQKSTPPSQELKDKVQVATVPIVKQRPSSEPTKKPVIIGETKFPEPPPVTELPPSAMKTGSPASKLPCHLCRKKYVIPPIVYCLDCDFYMSRFKPKC